MNLKRSEFLSVISSNRCDFLFSLFNVTLVKEATVMEHTMELKDTSLIRLTAIMVELVIEGMSEKHEE